MIGRSFQEQIDLAYKELELIAKETPPGNGAWRLQRRYIDGLEFAMDELKLEERKVKALEEIADRMARYDEIFKNMVRAIDGSMVF